MKLYVVDMNNAKHHLNITASSRVELATKLGSEVFTIGSQSFHVKNVFAERSNDSMPASTVIGGALGLVGGMPGVLIGGALGALLGNEADKKEQSAIDAFNRS